MKNDHTTTVEELKELLREFRDRRDWAQFHDPKNLAEAIAIEAGELQELFLWKEKQEVIDAVQNDEAFRREVGDELADVLMCCLHFVNATGLDAATILRDKLAKAEAKYPVEKAKGRYTKYTKL